jgi:hypothetical protein
MSRAAAAPQQKQKPLCGGACGPQEEPPARTSARVAGMARRRGRSSEPGRAREAVRSGPFTGRAEAYPVGKALSRVRAVRENSDVVAAASDSQVGGRMNRERSQPTRDQSDPPMTCWLMLLARSGTLTPARRVLIASDTPPPATRAIQCGRRLSAHAVRRGQTRL